MIVKDRYCSINSESFPHDRFSFLKPMIPFKILNEAVANDGESVYKRILFLETNPLSDDIGQNRFAIMLAYRRKGPDDIQPEFIFYETMFNMLFGIFREWNVVRKNPFSLEVLATVKVASSGFNLETQGLLRMIEEEVTKYQDLNERIKSFHLMD